MEEKKKEFNQLKMWNALLLELPQVIVEDLKTRTWKYISENFVPVEAIVRQGVSQPVNFAEVYKIKVTKAPKQGDWWYRLFIDDEFEVRQATRDDMIQCEKRHLDEKNYWTVNNGAYEYNIIGKCDSKISA
ncbi:MAG: hypothetical protein ABIJ40_10200 [Bacteroidota bacterium]